MVLCPINLPADGFSVAIFRCVIGKSPDCGNSEPVQDIHGNPDIIPVLDALLFLFAVDVLPPCGIIIFFFADCQRLFLFFLNGLDPVILFHFQCAPPLAGGGEG
jgi:hypothetical protein